ncbi:hypothetical protein [Streptomyces sp. NPDC002088]|uniref:hypothetical protein n=1 Tax=Streptomyces sp. NPDC002088 TaxID=3154665 RepID=UPI00332C88A8
MTQSGQGEEPSARPAREGIVLPSDGGEPLLPGMTAGPAGQQQHGYSSNGYQSSGQQYGPAYGQDGAGAAPAGGQAWGRPWGPEQQQGAPQPPAAEWPSAAPAETTWGTPEAAPPGPPWQPGPGAGPLPPEGAQPTAYGAPGAPGAPLPPAAHEGATQYLPPVPAMPGGADRAPQYLPPAAVPPADEGATQYIPPVGPGALPPEMPAAGAPSESTQFLGRAPLAGPPPNAAAHPDAQATQYIAPVPAQPAAGPYGGGLPGGGGDRQPPAEFDNLFRSDAGGAGGESPAGATQQLPRIPEHDSGYGGHGGHDGYSAQPNPSYAPPAGPGGGRRGARDGDGGGRGGRTGSRVPLIAAVGIAIAVVGIGAGALLGGGGGGDDEGDDSTTVSATAPATDGSASAAADPAKEQAVALDKLLADSGTSRTTVINAVAAVKSCDNLGQSASDLRAAAKQRTDLVTRLAALSVDKLPDHAALTTALTEAWKASASADNHYAAWADQTAANKKSCKKGQARTTPQAQAGGKASATASAQKKKAAQLWNAIAQKYGLTQRQSTQL